MPKDQAAYFRYFSGDAFVGARRAVPLQENESKRLTLYKLAAALLRAYANSANELGEAGYTTAEIVTIQSEVKFYENLRDEIKKHSGDAIDLKSYEPAMRHLIDTYIGATDSEKVSAFDDLSLIQLIVERGEDALNFLPKGIRDSVKASSETIKNNLRKLIINEHPINPEYYNDMSQLLDTLIKKRREEAIEYEKYLAEIVALTKQAANPAANPAGGSSYPKSLITSARRALYDNLGKNEELANNVDYEILAKKKDDWRGHKIKEKEVRYAIQGVLHDVELTDKIFEIVKHQRDY